MEYLSLHRAFWNTGTFWVTVAVVLFFVVFGRRMASGLLAAVDARADRIRGDIEEAQKLRREAEAMLRDAERRQRETIEMAREIEATARTRAARIAADLAREADESRVRQEALMTARIAAAQAAAMREVRAAATSLAVEAARQLLTEQFGPERDAAAIDHAIAELPRRLGRPQAA